jgi:hypothetical protein
MRLPLVFVCSLLGVGRVFMSELAPPDTPMLDILLQRQAASSKSLADEGIPKEAVEIDAKKMVAPAVSVGNPKKSALSPDLSTGTEGPPSPPSRLADRQVSPAVAVEVAKPSVDRLLPTLVEHRPLACGLLATFQLPCCGTGSLYLQENGSYCLRLEHRRRTLIQCVPLAGAPRAGYELICRLSDNRTELWCNPDMTCFQIVAP